jgi:RNA polymerase sigma factor (sigma-70 family)
MAEPSDAEVITASWRDPAAFGVLFDRHATTVHRYLVRRVGRDEADALLSETFRIAFERRESYDTGRAQARPWLYGIATNLISRHRRSEGRRLAAMARAGARLVPEEDAVHRAGEAVDAARLLPAVTEAARRLPEGERDALTLHAWEGLTYDEVAAALAIPVGTVRSRLARARGKLRELAAPPGEHLVHADVFARQKEQLMSTITGPAVPLEHDSRMYPRLAYRDERAALEYLTRVFGFSERREARVEVASPRPHILAWLDFGAGLVMIGPVNEDVHQIYSPLDLGHTTSMINVEVDDVDAHYARAVAEGAEVTMPLADAWYGGRRYEATDLEGHRWHFDESHAHIRARGGEVPDSPVPEDCPTPPGA